MEYGRNDQEEQQSGSQEWSEEHPPQQSQGQQPQSYREQQQPQQQQAPQYYHPGQPRQPLLGKKTIMVILVVSMLLVAISAVWLSIATVPDNDKVTDTGGLEADYREDYQKGVNTAQLIGGILATIGTALGGIISLYAGFMSKDFEEDEKKAMFILAGFFLLGLVLVVNHFSWMTVV